MEKTWLNTSQLGSTGLEITTVGFGAWAIGGGGWGFGWGPQHLALVERLQTVADRHEATPGAVAVAWTLRNPAVDGAIVGFRGPDQVGAIVGAANLELTDEDLDEIEGRWGS